MTKSKTPEEAATKLCPLARTFGAKELKAFCRGDECMAWVWEPAAADDPRFVAAIQREMASLAQDEATETGKAVPNSGKYHARAAQNVMRNPEGYGCPQHERGWCGLAR